MSTSAVSSASLYQQDQQYFHTRQTDLHQLGEALGTGDLAGAQAAFQDIAKLGQSGPFASGNPFSNPQREQDFTDIGKALQSGDLAAAQQAFGALKATFQNASGGSVPPNTAGTSTAGTSTSSTGPEIVLNLGNNSGGTGPERVILNIIKSTSFSSAGLSISA